MSDSRIHTSLTELFHRHRLIFWYDAAGEWRGAFDSYGNGSVEKLVVDRNEFGTKVKVLGEAAASKRFLLYVPAMRPPDGENWLLDLVLQGHEFKADRASLAVQEVGLPYEFRPLAEQHVEFFKDARRIQQLKEVIAENDEADSIRLKMMAVLVDAPADVESILLELLKRSATEELSDPAADAFAACVLLDSFWRQVQRVLGYGGLEPSMRDFVVHLFRGADPLEVNVRLSSHAAVFLQRWKDSKGHSSSFRTWSARLELELYVCQKLDGQGDRLDLGGADAYEAFEKFTIHRLCRAFEAEKPAADLKKTIQSRKQSFWYSGHADAYLAIENAIELRERLTDVDLGIESIEAGLERYRSIWWKIDRAYRLCCCHLRRYAQVTVMERLEDWVTKSYVNRFLLPLADQWSDKVKGMAKWTCRTLPSQREFFKTRVLPFQEKGQKIFVIISDALRYEAAADLAERINSENRFHAEMGAMLSSLPSYTQLGMASLLPGNELSVDPDLDSLPASVDGRSATGTENRDKILKANLAGRGAALQAEAFLALHSKTDGRTLMKDHDVIYIYHNVIDKTGDSAATEVRTLEAVEQAFGELMLIVKKVAAINGSNMLLTADHGFLFQQDEVHAGDAAALPKAVAWKNRARRFAIGEGVQPSLGVKVFTAEQLNLPGDWASAFPLALGKYPLQGSGKRYVHGGVSLQEVVIPVVHINKSRSDDTGRVEVDILSAPSKVTTGQVAFSIYQEKPVTTKLQARELRVALYALDGTCLSDVKTVSADSKSEEARQRETKVLLTLSSAADAYNNQMVEIRFEEALPGTRQTVTYKSHQTKLQKPFASDFDEF